MKDEKILKKIGKLLKLYGVEDEEQITSFLNDVQDAKYDEEEIVEEVKEETPVEETPTDEKVEETETEEKVEVEETEPTEETEPVEETETETEVEEEPTEQPMEEQPVEQPVEEVSEVAEEPQVEPQVEQPMETANIELDGKLEELEKVNEALVNRLSALEELIAKLGIEKTEVGATPTATPTENGENDTFNYYANKRVGR